MQRIRLQDREGTEIALEISLPEARRVRKQLGIDLTSRDGIDQACESLVTMADVIACVAADQLEDRGIDPEDFLRRLLPVADHAVDAFITELGNFCQLCGLTAVGKYAAAMVAAQRQDREDAAKVLSEETAGAIIRKATEQSAANRRKALEKFLGPDSTKSQG